MIEFAGAQIDWREIVAVQWLPLSLQTADARVHVFLRGGHKITEWFGQGEFANSRARARRDAILEERAAFIGGI